MSDDGFTLQTWTYAGRRQLKKGLGYEWIDHTGEERIFGKTVSATIVGGRYEVCCQIDGVRCSVRGVPRWLGSDAGRDERAPEWELENRAAYTAEQFEKAQRKAERENPLGELTLDQARERLSRSFGSNRTVLLAQILRYLGA